ncbi:hypothetical protein EYF80_005643 [Liparis tanakae]|uniref:Secreted protein n=1 Tax=Liparis tanakae TaxID=230148 RepID=A0A4Z2J1Y7_9TELE|nr:hypothetical protein EYF80_005643 [Liparis tanakae]
MGAGFSPSLLCLNLTLVSSSALAASLRQCHGHAAYSPPGWATSEATAATLAPDTSPFDLTPPSDSPPAKLRSQQVCYRSEVEAALETVRSLNLATSPRGRPTKKGQMIMDC